VQSIQSSIQNPSVVTLSRDSIVHREIMIYLMKTGCRDLSWVELAHSLSLTSLHAYCMQLLLPEKHCYKGRQCSCYCGNSSLYENRWYNLLLKSLNRIPNASSAMYPNMSNACRQFSFRNRLVVSPGNRSRMQLSELENAQDHTWLDGKQ
jgi:hypothetical protein